MLSLSEEFELTTREQELLTTTAVLGQIAGALGGGILANAIGRKKSVVLIVAGYAVFALLGATSVSVQMLVVARLLLGVTIGLSVVVVPVYVAESAPAAVRGSLVTAAAVEAMKPGSVVVDLAGETGGNCELTEPGRTVVKHDVTIAAPLNLPATMPEHASELYSKNITALLDLLIKDGRLAPDFDDEVIAQSCVTRGKDS